MTREEALEGVAKKTNELAVAIQNLENANKEEGEVMPNDSVSHEDTNDLAHEILNQFEGTTISDEECSELRDKYDELFPS